MTIQDASAKLNENGQSQKSAGELIKIPEEVPARPATNIHESPGKHGNSKISGYVPV